MAGLEETNLELIQTLRELLPAIRDLTPALREAVAAFKGEPAPTVASSGNGAATATHTAPPAPTGGRGRGRPPAAKQLTFEEVKAIAERVRDEIDRAVAVDLIKQHGAENLAKLDKAKYTQFFAAAEVLLASKGGDAAGHEADL